MFNKKSAILVCISIIVTAFVLSRFSNEKVKIVPTYNFQSNIAASWALGEASGTRAATTGGRDLTSNNSVGSATGLQNALAADFVPASSHYLSAVDNDVLDFTTGNFSISFWYKPELTGTLQFIWSKRQDGTNYVNVLQTASNEIQIEARVANIIVVSAITLSSIPFLINEWNCVQVIVDRTTPANTKIIVNNANRTTGTPTVSATTLTNTAELNIGRWGGAGFYFDGKIGPVISCKGYLQSGPEQFWLCNNGAGRTLAEVATGIPTTTGLVLCEGDSITYGYGIAAGSSYPHQLGTMLGSGYTVLSSGVSGKRITDGSLANTCTNEASRIDECYDASRPSNRLVVFCGTNDLANGDSAATAYSELVTYCQARQAAGWKVCVVTMLPRNDVSIEAARTTFNASVRSGWQSFANSIADIAADTAIGDSGDESNTTYYSDGIHPTAAGAAIVAGHISRALQTIGTPSRRMMLGV